MNEGHQINQSSSPSHLACMISSNFYWIRADLPYQKSLKNQYVHPGSPKSYPVPWIYSLHHYYHQDAHDAECWISLLIGHQSY